MPVSSCGYQMWTQKFSIYRSILVHVITKRYVLYSAVFSRQAISLFCDFVNIWMIIHVGQAVEPIPKNFCSSNFRKLAGTPKYSYIKISHSKFCGRKNSQFTVPYFVHVISKRSRLYSAMFSRQAISLFCDFVNIGMIIHVGQL